MVPAVADEARWRAAAGTWPDPDRVRGRARWTFATMVVNLVAVHGWVATDRPPQPSTLALVTPTLLPLLWPALAVIEARRLEGVPIVRDHLLGTDDLGPTRSVDG